MMMYLVLSPFIFFILRKRVVNLIYAVRINNPDRIKAESLFLGLKLIVIFFIVLVIERL